jgi:S-DNA-T family DNA segregation ATPase FtsK/SpoIIIE
VTTTEDEVTAEQPGTELEVRADNLPEPSDVPVVEGVIVDESPKSLTRRWAQHPKVPIVLKPASLVPDVKAARRDLAVRTAKAPVTTMPRAILRGLVVGVRLWWQWIVLQEERESARKNGKLDDRGPGIREVSTRRWKITGCTALGLVVVALLLRFVFTDIAALVLWSTVAVVAVGLMILGRAKDGTPGRKPVLGGRGFTWTMNPELLNQAYRDAGKIKKDQVLRHVKHADWDGKGWGMVFDLPPGVTADEVIADAVRIASALAVDEVNLSLERVRGDEGHAGRVSQWVAPKDPFGGVMPRYPLLDVERWDVWQPAPQGVDKRDRVVQLSLVWSSILIGAKPRVGKTASAWIASGPFILDPFVDILCWNGKGDRAWKAIKNIAYRYGNGHSDEDCERLRDALAELKIEVMRRMAAMDEMDDEECPDAKITPEMSRDGFPITLVIIDELQNYIECSAPGWPERGKKATVGQNIATLLIYMAKTAPSAGVVLLLATQRPDALTLPTGLRSQIGYRLALLVLDWRDSNMILGEQMNTRGYDASKLLDSHKGVGILRPDGELATGISGMPTIRTYWTRGRERSQLCARGRALREEAGTLHGHAAGEDLPVNVAAGQAVIDEGIEEDDVLDAEVVSNVPPLLAAILDYIEEDGGDDRERVPSMELLDILPTVAGCERWTETKLGLQLRKWGAPTGRTGRGGRSGPAISDLFAARDRIESGGPAEVVSGVEEAI